ncbi:MAG: hypothetical protein JNN33_01570, partial [Rhodospirillaceae bacterium]|nr:hypothetical protein [Rhodospirillaceae bacterium]
LGNPQLQTTGSAEASASASRTVLENMTLNQREAVWFDMTESAMRELDQKLEAAIRDKLRVFVR